MILYFGRADFYSFLCAASAAELLLNCALIPLLYLYSKCCTYTLFGQPPPSSPCPNYKLLQVISGRSNVYYIIHNLTFGYILSQMVQSVYFSYLGCKILRIKTMPLSFSLSSMKYVNGIE